MTDLLPVTADEQVDDIDLPQPTQEKSTSNKSFRKVIAGLIATLCVSFVVCFYLYSYLQTPPTGFANNSTFVIENGTATKQIIANLQKDGFVRSGLITLLVFRLNFKGESLKAGTYNFTEPLSVPDILRYLVAGEPKSDLVRLTFIEGESTVSFGRRAAANIENFDEAEFIDLALLHEGKLFPDTYLIPKDFSPKQLLEVLLKTFDENIYPLADKIANSNLSLDEIIILASIVEREANTEESMRIVSGILQNRLNIGMALQVDASMEYVLDKPLAELTATDLELDTPYNTYLYPGLPPTAIGNPGLIAIDAILNPTKTKYLFYITGNDGNFYYAEDFDTHKKNIERYLQ